MIVMFMPGHKRLLFVTDHERLLNVTGHERLLNVTGQESIAHNGGWVGGWGVGNLFFVICKPK